MELDWISALQTTDTLVAIITIIILSASIPLIKSFSITVKTFYFWLIKAML